MEQGMTADLPEGVWYAASARCWTCGQMVKLKAFGKRPKHHGCRLRWRARARWAGHLEGWHEGYRFAVEQPDDPMVLADRDDYGTGWAALMRNGGIEVSR